ncbi:unnamed protein product [Adineta steineri]|nr:unnamed protein product [Adineta steineri]
MNYQQITQQPRTVCPFYTNSATNDIHEPNQEQVEDRHSNQLDSMVSEDFYIISQPREKFHPRTESESIKSSHFVRCEDGDKYEYPITNISQTWRNQKNVIQVTLLGIDNQPHPYTIKNKECGKSSLVVKKNESNTIYYDVTNDDLVKGYKSYKIELIKGRQDGKKITKEKINQRQLNQSKLRFTRFYQTIDGSYERDESSVIDTIVMTEEYGKFRVEDVFPLDGPMQSKRKICIETKGPVPNDFKTNFVVNIIGNDINCSRKGEEIKKNGNNFSFEMPVLPNVHMNRVEAKINVQYKKDLIYQANYLYISSLDRELNVKTSNESNDRAAVNFLPDAPSTSSAMEFNSGNRSQKRTRK